MTNSEVEARRTVAWYLMESDLRFSTRFVASRLDGAEFKWEPIFGMVPYLSMFVYECYLFLKKNYPDSTQELELSNLPIIRRSRHSAKLLDLQSGDNVEHLARYFQAEVVEHHQRHYAPPRTTKGLLMRPLYNDIGLYFYNNHLVSNTHSASLNLGIESTSEASLTSKADIDSFAEECGQFLNIMGHGLPPDASSFASEMDSTKITTKDRKSEKYYAGRFDTTPPSGKDGLNALLVALQCTLNFLRYVVILDFNTPSFATSLPTLLKLYLVTGVHVAASSRRLLKDYQGRLDASSRAALNAILREGRAHELTSQSTKFLRNVFVHYLPHSTFSASDLRPDAPLLGLVEKYGDGKSILDLIELAVGETTRQASIFDEWAERRFKG